jgi:CBS domain-containing protein
LDRFLILLTAKAVLFIDPQNGNTGVLGPHLSTWLPHNVVRLHIVLRYNGGMTSTAKLRDLELTALPVIEREPPGTPVGVVTLHDLLQARVPKLEEETHRERHLGLGVGPSATS